MHVLSEESGQNRRIEADIYIEKTVDLVDKGCYKVVARGHENRTFRLASIGYNIIRLTFGRIESESCIQ
jgi:hypothetical protein